MAKQAAKKTAKSASREIAPRSPAATTAAPVRGGAVPAYLQERAQKDAGKGVSTAHEDNLVPLIYILQANSPQCKRENPAYIDGAKAGDIWLRNSPEPLVDGEEGIEFQPCYFEKDIVEWVPRRKGGGFVARHKEMPADVEQTVDPENPNRKTFIRKSNGNECIETRYHMGYVHMSGQKFPYVIPLTGTGHSFSRAWMFMMNAQTLPGDSGVAPSYAMLYTLKPKYRQKNSNDWFMWEIDGAPRWVETAEDYDRGAALYKAFAMGQKQADRPEQQEEDGESRISRANI